MITWLEEGVPTSPSCHWPVEVTAVLPHRTGTSGAVIVPVEGRILGSLNAMKNFSLCTPQQST